jgi:hypothetical protein
MVQHKNFIPTDKFKLQTWMSKLSKKVAGNIGNFGITDKYDKDLKKLTEDLVNDTVREQELIDEKRKQVKISQANRKKAVDACRRLAQIIKADPAYTDAVGKDFDIIGAEREIDVDTSKPVLKAKKVPHGWEFSFGLESYFSGVNIYRKHPDQDKFHYLASDTRSPYVDNQEMVNGTKYYAYYILGDTEVGQQSDIVTIEV